MKLGTSFSQRHLDYIGLDFDQALLELTQFGFDIVRLGCYWDDIEPKQDTFDFSLTKKMLDACEQAGLDVVLTIGMKAPRWPEYFVPSWLKARTPAELETSVLHFIERCIEEFKQYTCIKYWQVENEPLDPSGPHEWAISRELLAKEVALVKKLDEREIIVTFWGNELSKRNLYTQVTDFADFIGIDMYYKVPLGNTGAYWKPNDSDRKLQKIIAEYPRPVWIAELQAEPWEPYEVYTEDANPKSINHELLLKNYQRACTLGADTILFWGFEYWLWKREHGDSRMWDTAKDLVRNNKK